MTDYYSRYFEICPLQSMSENEIIKQCKTVFSHFGIPDVVRSDCGTQFSTGFRRFASEYDFKHVTSSPKFSQSNGAAEAAVKIAKNLIKKCDDIDLGILAYRTAPLENGFSPAELMFSRKIKSNLPTLPANLGTFSENSKVTLKENERKKRQEKMYNKRHRSSNLRDLKTGESVWIIDNRIYGKIIKRSEQPNSFIIRTEKGNAICRNRWHIIPAPHKDSLETNNKDLLIFESDLHAEPTRPSPTSDIDHDKNLNANGNDSPAQSEHASDGNDQKNSIAQPEPENDTNPRRSTRQTKPSQRYIPE